MRALCTLFWHVRETFRHNQPLTAWPCVAVAHVVVRLFGRRSASDAAHWQRAAAHDCIVAASATKRMRVGNCCSLVPLPQLVMQWSNAVQAQFWQCTRPCSPYGQETACSAGCVDQVTNLSRLTMFTTRIALDVYQGSIRLSQRTSCLRSAATCWSAELPCAATART